MTHFGIDAYTFLPVLHDFDCLLIRLILGDRTIYWHQKLKA
jgi:hypothetical protein